VSRRACSRAQEGSTRRRADAQSFVSVRAWLRRVPSAAWICALVACLSAISWSFVTPAFQAPDEQAHFAYVEVLARTGQLPSSSTQEYALDEVQTLEDLEVGRVTFQPDQRTIASIAKQRKLESDLAHTPATLPPGVGAAGDAASEPPLYYALETIPYAVGESGGVLDQLTLMRLVSALLAGFTTLFVFLFLREALPSTPRAWTVAGLGVAFLPLLGYMSGAVNPDAMLCAVSAAVFYCLARAFRRGLTPRLAVAIGVLTAAGFLTKLDFLGLAPGVVLGLALLAKRSSRTLGVSMAARMLAVALAIAAAPGCVYLFSNLLSHHQTLGLVSGVITTSSDHSLLGEASYIWQLYLPRLPGMHVDFADISPLRYLWFNGLVGDYGFEDTWFPNWVDNLAVLPALAIAALSAREIFVHRWVLRRRVGELGVYLVLAGGLLIVIGATSYLSFPVEAASFPEPRYLLPLIPIFGGVLALATRGAGRRWGAAAGALIVVLFFAHDIFSQLLVIGRYYG
jgi:4-amino-4-deoxy-L-arabinose transferase-like glycosyltransferase